MKKKHTDWKSLSIAAGTLEVNVIHDYWEASLMNLIEEIMK